MYLGFPKDLLRLIRCPKDQFRLECLQDFENVEYINEGSLICTKCKRIYRIEEGIPLLLESQEIDDESRSELAIRDETSREVPPQFVGKKYTEYDCMEMEPTIGALDIESGQTLLEFGCGTGRYTLPLAEMGVSILAVDFSIESLRLLARRLPSGLPVGLVQGDVTNRCVVRGAFDRVLSTLVSNLPTREHRLSMLRVASEALKENGSFVFGTHHQNIVYRLLGLPPAGRYADCGIYRYFMQQEEIHREAAVYFRRISCRPIRVNIPLTKWTGLSASTISRIAERIPLLRQKGDLLLAKTREPINPPREGEGTRPNPYFAYVHSVLKNIRGIRSNENRNRAV
jgi:uncharacterized protein YbaR (Trm112 family)